MRSVIFFLMAVAVGIFVAPPVLQYIHDNHPGLSRVLAEASQGPQGDPAASSQLATDPAKWERHQILPEARPSSQPTAQPLTLYVPPPEPQKWQEIDSFSIVNDSFEVPRFRAWTLRVPSDGGTARRFTLTGQFGTDKPVRFAVVDQDNFTRLQSGYPFFAAYTTEAGPSFTTIVRPGDYDLVFYQVAGSNSELQIPNSAAGLVALAIKGIIANQPAHVTAELSVEDDYFTTAAIGQQLRDKMQAQRASTLTLQDPQTQQ